MPPGGNGLTIEMGRVGYGSWAAEPGASAKRASTSIMRRGIMAASRGGGLRKGPEEDREKRQEREFFDPAALPWRPAPGYPSGVWEQIIAGGEDEGVSTRFLRF